MQDLQKKMKRFLNLDYPYKIEQVKELLEPVKKLNSTYLDMYNAANKKDVPEKQLDTIYTIIINALIKFQEIKKTMSQKNF